MDPNIEGLPPSQEPSKPAVPAAQGAAQEPNQQSASSNPSQELEQAKAELLAERTRAQNLENLARTQQSRADQATNQLRAITGQQPQADPLADDIQYFTKGGLNPDDAKLVAGFVHQKISKIEQQYQQQAQALQASSQVQSVYDAAARANPQLFADQNYARAAYNALQEAALHNPQYVTPQYAEAIAKQEWADAYWKNQNTPAATQFQPQANPQYQSIPSFNGPPGGYTPAAASPAKPTNPLTAKYDAEIAARYPQK